MGKKNRDSKITKEKLEEGNELHLQFEKSGGLLPVVVQESASGEILMLAYVNREALQYSIENKQAAFWSRSREELWVKGETSGNRLHLRDVWVDCDQDALIYKVTLEGDGVCHTKNEKSEHRKSCFYRKVDLESGKLHFD